MGFIKFIQGIGKRVYDSEPDENSSGDKYLDYLRKEEQLRRNEIEKKILKRRLELNQKQRFKKFVKPTMITGKYKKKPFQMRL
jgi:hypothetical protein